MHVTYSHMAVTDVLLTAGITVALALLVVDRLEWAGVAIGLAVSAKYPGAFLAVPLLLAGWGRWRRLAAAAGLALAAFALTSPFVLLNAGAAWDDVSRVQRLARAGLARLRERPCDADRVPRPAVGEPGARAAGRRGRGSRSRSGRLC